ncbi:hypothetical protein [Botrimarina mediterranea]|uniref:hypothetical protein n=1 Tax=Botrimarina mediterranea TaxID=2528022 RepID=UPI00118B76A9|nr:hypothetical protein K2D_34870 [Planctomycetes bacterium K2D]
MNNSNAIGTWRQSKLPGVLGKAEEDQCWSYACELVSGRVYAFEGVTDLGDGWIKLHAWTGSYHGWGDLANVLHSVPHAVPERGLTVRVDQIRWAAECAG